MRLGTQMAGTVRIGAILFMAAIAGCTISIQPWTKPQPPPPAPFPDGGGPMNPNLMSKNGGHGQNVPANNEETAQMIKKLNEEQDLCKALENQVETLKRDLKKREDTLRLASFEMDESTKQIKRTREEFRQWQSEMEELRERIRKLEDYRSSAKPLIEDIYRFLDRDKEPAKMFKPAPPKQ
jgi:hypothetical protein